MPELGSEGRGEVTATEALVQSLNVTTAKYHGGSGPRRFS